MDRVGDFLSIHQAQRTMSHIRLADQATAMVSGGGGPKRFIKWTINRKAINNKNAIFRLKQGDL
jgi:hypothetical protein